MDPFLLVPLLLLAGVLAGDRKSESDMRPTLGPPAPGSASLWPLTQTEVVQAVKDGRAEFAFTELPGAPGVFVTSDAIKIDGVRVPVTAQTTQAVPHRSFR